MKKIFLCLLIGLAIVIAGCKISLPTPPEAPLEDGAVESSFAEGEIPDVPKDTPVEIPVIDVAPAPVDTGEKYFSNASWECSDGYRGGFDGFGESCKSEETWMKYAETDCRGRCNGGCGVRELLPVETCDGKESDSYLLQRGKKVAVAFDDSFILLELQKVHLNGKVEIDVDFGDEIVENTTLEPRKTLKYRNISITSNQQFYNREQPESSAAEFLVGKLMQQTTQIGSSACSLLSNAICPKGCLPGEDYDCCEAAGRCWTDGRCEDCVREIPVLGDYNENGYADSKDLQVMLKVLGSVKGGGQNEKGASYDAVFDFDADGDVDNDDYTAFSKVQR